MIRIDALWLCTQPQDMRAGAERLMAQVVHTLGRASAHHGYLFANARATRMKLLVHDGFGVRGREYGVNQDSGVFFDTDAHEALIGQLKLRRLERFTYEYDFGDLWVHDLRIEATLPLDPKRVYPVCIAGQRAAPPEDCGGPRAFMATRFEYTLIGESRSRHEFDDLSRRGGRRGMGNLAPLPPRSLRSARRQLQACRVGSSISGKVSP